MRGLCLREAAWATHVTYAVLHCLTSAHPCIQCSCGIQYMSCNFHCISDKGFSLLKKKSNKVVKSFGQLDSIKVCEAVPTFTHNVYRSTHGLGQKLQETPHSQRWRSLLSKANTGRNCSMGKDLRATYHLSGKGTAAHLIPS